VAVDVLVDCPATLNVRLALKEAGVSVQKIAVLGTGANGAGIAADLVRAGRDVTLIEQWPEHVEAMRSNGIRVEMPQETQTTDVRAMQLCEVATLREQFDLVLVLVKAYDTRWACELIKPHLRPDGVAVGVQNGMTIDPMIEILGRERTLGSVIEVSSAMFTPGVVERHSPPSASWFALGGVQPDVHARAPEVAEVLSAAGTVEIVDDIRSAKWMKLVVNAAELVLSAILNLSMLDTVRVPGMHEFMLRAGGEAIRTAVTLGHQVVPIFGLTDVDPSDHEAFVRTTLDAVFTMFSLPHTRTTVLHDWLKGRRSEVDEINGLVVREQTRLGGECTANARIVETAHRIERGELAVDPSNVDLLVATRV
jgi:2-dehydropantoate 2-reductase